MATQNITIDQNSDTNVDITDASALDGDIILMQFYQNDVNIFNLAMSELGGETGEITIDEGVKYVAEITAKKALLLNPADTITHKVFKFDANNKPTEIHDGSVTVTPLSGSSPSQAELTYNNDRMYERSITGTTGTLTKNDQVVYCENASGVALTLPSAEDIPGKEFFIKNFGAGDVTFVIEDGTVTLNTGEVAWIRARGVVSAADYVILYYTGAIV
jgi:hypothetical protein